MYAAAVQQVNRNHPPLPPSKVGASCHANRPWSCRDIKYHLAVLLPTHIAMNLISSCSMIFIALMCVGCKGERNSGWGLQQPSFIPNLPL